ncbi:MAG: calcium/sodium antiporter [Halobacteriota archaeon]|nr:calcium/sodium antiporter [Halobacteriota archaeon]
MLQPLIFLLALIAGFALMIKSADVVTDHASLISKKRGISEMTIGMILVALATSLPELAVSTTSAFFGETGIALGNILGSNITNIAFVLGICALIRPIVIDKRAVKFDGIWMLLSTAIVVILMGYGAIGITTYYSPHLDENSTALSIGYGNFGRIDGSISLLFFIIFLYFLKKNENDNLGVEKSGEPILIDIVMSLSAGAIVWVGSWLVMWAVEGFAEYFGINPIYLALTVVALGTSLPELFVSISALRKGLRSISVGNLIGSNMFNLLIVLGISSIIRPILITDVALTSYIPMMVFTSVLGIIFMRTRWRLDRWEGFILVALYVLFVLFVFGV